MMTATREKLMADATAIVSNAVDGKLTAGQVGKFEKLMAEIDLLDASKTSTGRKTQPDDVYFGRGFNLGDSQVNTTSTLNVGNRGRRYRDLFPGQLSNAGFETFDDYLTVLKSGKHHDGLAKLAATSGVASEGGFFIPTEHSAEMLDKSLEDEIVRSRADVRPMTSDTKKVAGFHHSDASGGSLFGGFTAKWKGEADSGDVETPKTRQIELTAKKLFIYTKSSNELLADGESYETQLSTAMISAAGWHMDDSFLNGPGGNQPVGVLNDVACIEVAKEVGQGAATIVYENLAKMFARIHPACIGNSVWVCNSTAIPQLLTLSIAVGTGGAYIPVLTESNGMFRMLTRPVVFSEKMQALGTSGDILLADFSQYVIGMRKEVTMDASGHVGFATDETAFRTIVRVDGQGKWSAAYTPKNGDTQSWAVKLATRS